MTKENVEKLNGWIRLRSVRGYVTKPIAITIRKS